MLTCKSCNTTSAIHYRYIDGTWYCRDCGPENPSRIQTNARHYWEDGKGSITSAHLDDIKHRSLAPDGSVYRETHRKSVRI